MLTELFPILLFVVELCFVFLAVVKVDVNSEKLEVSVSKFALCFFCNDLGPVPQKLINTPPPPGSHT